MNALFYRRLLAWLFDRFVILILFYITSLVVFGLYNPVIGLALGAMTIVRDNSIEFTPHAYRVFLYLLVLNLLVGRAYYLIFDLFYQGTLGKKIFKLGIICSSNNMTKLGGYFFRTFLYLIFYAVIFILTTLLINVQNWIYVIITNLVLYLPVFFTKKNQTLYDLISSIQIVTKAKKLLESQDDINSEVRDSYSKWISKYKTLKFIIYICIITTTVFFVPNILIYNRNYSLYELNKSKWEPLAIAKYKSEYKIYDNLLKRYSEELEIYNNEYLKYCMKKREYDLDVQVWRGTHGEDEYNKLRSYLAYKRDVYYYMASAEKYLACQKLEYWYFHSDAPRMPIEPKEPFRLVSHLQEPIDPLKDNNSQFACYNNYFNISSRFWDITFVRNPVNNILPFFLILLFVFGSYYLFVGLIKMFQNPQRISNYIIGVVSFVLAINLLNYIFRWYVYFYSLVDQVTESNHSINLLDKLSYYLVVIFVLSAIFSVFFAFIYSKLKLKENLFFPFNTGINRLLIVVFILLSIYNEVFFLIETKFYFWTGNYCNILKFYGSNTDESSFSGLVIMLFLIIAYSVLVWVYNGFGKKSI